MINFKIRNIIISIIAFYLFGCTAENYNDSTTYNCFDEINVGSTTMSQEISSTIIRASDNEWFNNIMLNGIEITYGKSNGGNDFKGDTKTALLKREGNIYSLKDKDGNTAKWLGNGAHLFMGKYTPEILKNDGNNFYTDQSGNNFVALSQFISTPPATNISATVAKITLPFIHRLAHIKVYVIIDDNVKEDYSNPDSPRAIIKGYNKEQENAGGADCAIRFCNVNVLKSINADDNKLNWDTAEKVIPHFIEEKENVEYLENEETNNYTNVPLYDIIVQPTYNTDPLQGEIWKLMMPDEPNKTIAETNKIVFSLTLNNGMEYSKEFEFDLNPNEQTTVYLHITRETIDYNQSGAEIWIANNANDNLYGIDNINGNALSKAGSSWQRAFRIGTNDNPVTDGSSYSNQYLSKDEFIENLKEAHSGGKYHGAYFILTQDLDLANWSSFDFTGHLDGRGHTISISPSPNSLFTTLNGNYDVTTYGDANVHNDNSPIKGRRAEIMNLNISNGNNLISGDCSGYIYNCSVISPGKLYGSIIESGEEEECITKQ